MSEVLPFRFDPREVLERIGIPRDCPAPMSVTITAARMERLIMQLPPLTRARDAVWVGLVFWANVFAQIDFPAEEMPPERLWQAIYNAIREDMDAIRRGSWTP